MRYIIVIEKGETSFGAYVSESEAEVRQLIQEAMELHLGDLQNAGAEIPKPLSKSEYDEVLTA